MSMHTAHAEIEIWINRYTGEKAWILFLALIAALYLLIFCKDIRTRIIIPILLVATLVLNPILYKYVYKPYGITYWRLFWIFPDCIMIAFAFSDLIQRFQNQWLRCVLILICASMILLLGKNTFLPEEGFFSPADSPYKVHPETRLICEEILKDNPHPKCIFHDGDIFDETRQYSGDIQQLYGRDSNGYIIRMSDEAYDLLLYWKLDPPNFDHIFWFAQQNEYTHLCFYDQYDVVEIARNHGYEILNTISGYVIYHQINNKLELAVNPW